MRVLTFMIAAMATVMLTWAPDYSRADPTPSTQSIETPAPAPSPLLKRPASWRNSLDGFASLVDQAAAGSGLTPPEGPGFAAGSPLSPMTPYDTFASTPNTQGIAGLAQFVLTTHFTSSRMNASLQSGIGYATGSTTNNAYWTESLMPTLNPHLGSRSLPYAVGFPTHAGQDDGTNARASILGGSVGANNGSWLLRGGWFNLNQSDRFVFAQPPLTNLTPAVTAQTAESLGNGAPALDGWPSPPSGLPLQGIDLTLHEKSTTLEVTSAALPSLPGTSARLNLGSLVLDRGSGTRFSADFLHLATSGDMISTSTLFGQSARLNLGPQGELPTSNLGGQTQTIAGLRAEFHVANTFDGLVEVGRAWYNANDVLLPGTEKPGGYYHAALLHAARRATTSIEAYRFEPRYATAILPYGAPENIWSVAWSWPGIWLKSAYQLTDNSIIGANRQGYRLRYALNGGPFEIHAAYGAYQQVELATTDNGTQTGLVEGFYLPQFPGAGTLGRMHQYAVWLAWHPRIADVTVDYVDDTMHRDFLTNQPQDAVSLNAPQIVLAASRSLTKSALVSIGYGRYAMRGSWAQGSFTNVDFAQNVAFAGTQLAESKQAVVLVQVRSSAFRGLPSIIGGPSPNDQATMLIVEQRFHV
ncbi:MAG: hypothetical protein M3Z41_10325 [Candidatus Eremiobacteraeota bacterium]|nr:hypothetical protein [Candidatus Eremiobacteraeota bacterium]